MKSKTVIAGTPVNSVCVLEKHERYGSSKPEDRMRAKKIYEDASDLKQAQDMGFGSRHEAGGFGASRRRI